MRMYTSCGWFFDDISGLETTQVLQYAARAADLAEELFGRAFHEELARRLEPAKSNGPEFKNGREVYERRARGGSVLPRSICAQYALESLFADPGERTNLYGFSIEREAFRSMQSGRARLAAGRLTMRSRRTLESRRFAFAALHLGDHLFHGGVRELRDAPEEGAPLDEELCAGFGRGDLSDCLLRLAESFGEGGFDLGLLPKDGQRKIISHVVDSALEEAASAFRQVYANHVPVLRLLKARGLAAPKALHAAAELSLQTDLRGELERSEPSAARVAELLDAAEHDGIRLESDEFAARFASCLQRLTERLSGSPRDASAVESLAAALRLSRRLPFQVNVWKVQNAVFQLIRGRQPAAEGEGRAIEPGQLEPYGELAELLSLRLEPPAAKPEPAAG